jgi:hypothetical protein
VAGTRRSIPAATEAALWVLSSGRCYAPGCPCPVVVEIRRGVFRKNAQIAHIFGVREGAVRFDRAVPDEDRDAFINLLLLFLAHHGEVDDKKTGERLYPPDLLQGWKVAHEGADGPALAALGRVDEDRIGELLAEAFTPPVERLQAIADQLEQTGTLTAASFRELRQVIGVLTDSPAGPDRRTAAILSDAAAIFGRRSFEQAASALGGAADTLSVREFSRHVSVMSEAAQSIASSVEWLRRHRGDWDR